MFKDQHNPMHTFTFEGNKQDTNFNKHFLTIIEFTETTIFQLLKVKIFMIMLVKL